MKSDNGNTFKQEHKKQDLIATVVVSVISIVVLVLFGMHRFAPEVLVPPSPTPTGTEIPATLTPTLEPSLTPTSTATSEPTPTNTLLPPSAYQIQDFNMVEPAVPVNAMDGIILNEDTNVTPEPAFDHPQWYSSETISEQLAIDIYEPYFATIGNGSATWEMDKAISPGLYEIFVLDTSYSSAGPLDFMVRLGSNPITPLTGQQTVNYLTTQGSPYQSVDLWQSIGIYDIQQTDILSVYTEWEAREQTTIVAIDRVLIVRLPEINRQLLNALPQSNLRFIADDYNAKFDTRDTLYARDDKLSWGGEFQMLVNPSSDSTVTWRPNTVIPPGKYEILIWVPEVQGTAEVAYRLLVNDQEYQGAIWISMNQLPSEQWVSIGTWDITSYADSPVLVELQLEMEAATQGQIAVDAMAIIAIEN